LDQQKSVWGLTTNAVYYEFIHVKKNIVDSIDTIDTIYPTYQPLPSLHLMEPESSEKLLQVLKAICKSQNSISPL
jgi:hypothetical protein